PEAIADRPAARAAARARLGLPADAFAVCSFGVVAPSKLSHRLLDAWFGSSLGADPRARLVFVGENDPGAYGDAMRARIEARAAGARVAFTGYASAQAYADHLVAADLAVQLRTSTRGESSGAVVDCLAHGLPLVVNAHGPAADLPGECVALLDDLFADADLIDALETLRSDESARTALSENGSRHVARVHLPRTCAEQYRDAIEHFAVNGRHARRARLVDAAAAFALRSPGTQGTQDGLQSLAAAIAAEEPPQATRRLLVDITAVAVHDLRSGIQRVVRAVLGSLLERPPQGWRVEPVYQDVHGYRHARRFTLGLLGADPAALDDDPAEAGSGDVFLGLDLVTDGVRQHRAVFERWRARGARVHFVVYDLLPVLHPEWFPDEAVTHYRGWLDAVCGLADGLVCISRSVRDELEQWLAPIRAERPRLGWFHLGGDLEASLPSRGLGDEAQAMLERLASTPCFLMVGTVEPRKGHAQALEAFELLWARGLDCRLLIVGRAGWMVDALVARLRAHPELGARLVWLEDASDELLALCYQR
ncbi:MAG TPA: glycosyltransferase, partial [Quisquiliibacterium sp.]|nr:glycosyltransferase [Quisquiliibacterium sp.]